MTLSIALLHERPEYMQECCNLLNDEWKRSDTARMRGLELSCDTLPTNLILLENKTLIGHLKLSSIPSITKGCFVESVVIQKPLRGKGYGTILMNMAEEYCKNCLNLKEVYLSTKGQEEFYRKLGYSECAPVSIYGCPIGIFQDLKPPPGAKINDNIISLGNNYNNKNIDVKNGIKTYMMKIL
ncbi:hypothetical protein HHI36_003603 [Cryptolaemus montrouzieri]|uniref:N-acetyltransferase domain-containing protein n=1 Tax=Cryptolaemus montrouzieri TaxID=559131 RepID=A0ABD2PEN2_9CUCU